MQDRILIRDFSIDDLQDVVSIGTEDMEVGWDPGMFMEAYTRGALFLVADCGGVVIGFILADAADEGTQVIMNIAVDAHFRNKGIGTRLVLEMEKKANEKGSRNIILHVKEQNSDAIRFYDGLGYKKVGVAEMKYADGSDAIVMRKTLV